MKQQRESKNRNNHKAINPPTPLPGAKLFDRVEEIMQGDRALRGFLQNRTQTIVTESGDSLSYCPEAVLIATELYEENPKVKRARKQDVLRVAVRLVDENKILIAGNTLSATAGAPPTASAPPLMGENQIEIAYGEAKGIYTVNPVAFLFPRTDGEVYQELKRSIEKNGQQDPCVVDGNNFLDGLTRVRILNELGEPTRVIQFADLKTDLTPDEWIYMKNFARRHLTDDQRLATAAKFMEWQKRQAEDKGVATAGSAQDSDGDAQTEYPQKPAENTPKRKRGRPRGQRSEAEQLAKEAKQSQYKSRRVIKLLTESPELAAEVQQGRLTLKEAMARLNAKEPSGKVNPQHASEPSALEQAVKKAERLLAKAVSKLPPDEEICFWDRVIDFASKAKCENQEKAGEESIDEAYSA